MILQRVDRRPRQDSGPGLPSVRESATGDMEVLLVTADDDRTRWLSSVDGSQQNSTATVLATDSTERFDESDHRRKDQRHAAAR